MNISPRQISEIITFMGTADYKKGCPLQTLI
jgi:hypothetical protein